MAVQDGRVGRDYVEVGRNARKVGHKLAEVDRNPNEIERKLQETIKRVKIGDILKNIQKKFIIQR